MIKITKKHVFFAVAIIGFLKLMLLITTHSFFGLITFSSWIVWILVILFLIFMYFFFMFVFKSRYSLKFLLILIVSIAIITCTVGFVTKAITIGNGTNTDNSTNTEGKVEDTSEWIWYTGPNSNLFAFKYPRTYFIQEYSTTVMVYANEDSKSSGGDHLTFSQYPADPQSTLDIVASCESFARSIGESADNSIGKDYKFRYAKVTSLNGIQTCESGISMIPASRPEGGRTYEFSYSFIAKETHYGITGYAQKESGLGIFHQIAETFQLK